MPPTMPTKRPIHTNDAQRKPNADATSSKRIDWRYRVTEGITVVSTGPKTSSRSSRLRHRRISSSNPNSRKMTWKLIPSRGYSIDPSTEHLEAVNRTACKLRHELEFLWAVKGVRVGSTRSSCSLHCRRR